MFDRFFHSKPTPSRGRPGRRRAGPDLGRRHRHRPTDRRQARGDAARAGPAHRLGRVHPGPRRERRPRHQRRRDRRDRARAPGARGARRGDRRPRDRDGQAPGEDRRRHRGLRRDPRVQGARRRWTSGSSSCAPASRSWPPTARSRPRRPRSINQIAEELDIDDAALNAIRADYHEQLSSVQEIRRVTGGA